MPVSDLGAVIIGRNEGERLRMCLASVCEQIPHVVYVDSGSSDGSVGLARDYGADVVELDMTQPFTAARARNAGFNRLLALQPQLRWVQFIDGDCELNADWPTKAVEFLAANPDCAVVCGRRRERYPEASIYNQLCDIEWDTPIGEAKACGGDAVMRVAALQAVSGYRDDLIAGEEPELCFRLRAQGWRVWRLDAEMTLHDAAMTRFGQWWRRAKRSGFAYANAVWLHGDSPERFGLSQTLRIWVWAAILPLGVFVLSPMLSVAIALLIAIYLLQILRLYYNNPRSPTFYYSVSLLLCKFPQLFGQIEFFTGLLMRRQAQLIEYK